MNIQNLASVPSVVYGILGLAFIVRGPVDICGLGQGSPTLLAGALTLGLLVLPVVIIVSREAIRAVPPSIREGSLALGATKWQTIWKRCCRARSRASRPASSSRCRGRSARPRRSSSSARSPSGSPIRRSTASSPRSRSPSSAPRSSRATSSAILAAGAIVVLLVVLLLMNSVAIYLRNRYEQKW